MDPDKNVDERQTNVPQAGDVISPSSEQVTSGISESSNDSSVTDTSDAMHEQPIAEPEPAPLSESNSAQSSDAGSTQPSESPAAVATSSIPSASAPASKESPKKPHRLLVPILALSGLLVLVGAFLVYRQYTSSPNYVWSHAFTNTAKGYDKATASLKDMTTKDYESASVSGDFSVKTGGAIISGTMSGDVGKKSGEGSIDLTYESSLGGNEMKLKAGLDAKVIDSGGDYPDVYFRARDLDKISGLLQGFGINDAQASQLVAPFDNQWVVLTGDELKQYVDQSAAAVGSMWTIDAEDTESQLDAKSLITFVNSLSESVDGYLLSSNPDKAVVQQKEFVGKEKSGDNLLYHYKASINKTNLKAFTQAARKTFADSDLAKQMGVTADQLPTIDEINKELDTIDDSYTFDVWIDKGKGLINKMSFTDPSDKSARFEVGLPVVDGDEIPLSFGYIDTSKNINVKATVALNTKSQSFKVSLQGGDSESSVNVSIKITPETKQPKITAPEGAKGFESAVQEAITGMSNAAAVSPTDSLLFDYGLSQDPDGLQASLF